MITVPPVCKGWLGISFFVLLSLPENTFKVQWSNWHEQQNVDRTPNPSLFELAWSGTDKINWNYIRVRGCWLGSPHDFYAAQACNRGKHWPWVEFGQKKYNTCLAQVRLGWFSLGGLSGKDRKYSFKPHSSRQWKAKQSVITLYFWTESRVLTLMTKYTPHRP